MSFAEQLPEFGASWIWRRGGIDHGAMLDAAIFTTTVRLDSFQAACLRISADCRYRLYLNNTWIADGPARAWPEYYLYDQLDVTGHLCVGLNTVRAIVWYYGHGTFQHLPQQPGLIAQLDLQDANGYWTTASATNATWLASHAAAWRANVPKTSAQKGAFESYDARLESDSLGCSAEVICDAGQGPWGCLKPCDVVSLTSWSRDFTRIVHARGVMTEGECVRFPAMWLSNPGRPELSGRYARPIGFVSHLHVAEPGEVRMRTDACRVWIDGLPIYSDESRPLAAGTHLVTVFAWPLFPNYLQQDIALTIWMASAMRLSGITSVSKDSIWSYFLMSEYSHRSQDYIPYPWFDEPTSRSLAQQYEEAVLSLAPQLTDTAAVLTCIGEERLVELNSHLHLLEDPYDTFRRAQVICPATICDTGGENRLPMVVSPGSDVELCFDLGDQSCGYLDLDVECQAGVHVDAFAVEYMRPDGIYQHTDGNGCNRNGFRYTTREGRQQYTSFNRRGGRYWVVIIRGHARPVVLHGLRLVESTYPIERVAHFECNSAVLNHLWRMSTRTMQLCMEDAYTDCPLYEQATWIGDVRLQNLFGRPIFGASDIGRRSICLGAESLRRLPLVAAVAPSAWATIIPAWSFLWGMSVWDEYFFSGDEEWLAAMWPAVMQNMSGAMQHLSPQGLFRGEYWNMFDWANVDDRHATVIHNSQWMVAALDSAIRSADVLRDVRANELRDARASLVNAINQYWDPIASTYPDSINAAGVPSSCSSTHTLVLGLLFDVIPENDRERALARLCDPATNLSPVSSPFAAFFLYQVLEKYGKIRQLFERMEADYSHMLDGVSTTVWEVFSHGTMKPDAFPTRSHCHAWSASPLYFLHRHVLGIQPVVPGGSICRIDPHYDERMCACGQVLTGRGLVAVQWARFDRRVEITVVADRDIEILFNTDQEDEHLLVQMRRVTSSDGLSAIETYTH